jgi:arylsulfatase A-like enzyme
MVPPRRPGTLTTLTAFTALTALAALLPLGLVACGRPAGGTRVVLVTLDTLRYDCVAGPSPAMPRLAAVAARSTSFSNAYASSSSTQPTHASLLTGLHPWQHGVHRNGSVLAEAHTTVPERLAAAGWWTGAVVASFPLDGKFGFGQGFAAYDDEFSADLDVNQWTEAQAEGGHFYTPCEQVTDRALALLDGAPGERQFLWVHYFDAHAPYGETGDGPMKVSRLLAAARQRSPELPALIDEARRLYDQDVASIDRALARLLSRLEQDAPEWETHLVVTTDHGESFGDDGAFGHGSTVSKVQVQSPLIVLSPRVAAGPRADTAGSIDVASTLLALAGLSPAGFGHGRDLGPPRAGTRTAASTSAFGMRRTYAEPSQDVRLDGSVEQLQGTLEFFAVLDGVQAIGNARALDAAATAAPLDVDRAQDLRTLFSLFESELQAQPTEELLDADTQARLEALGYVR